MLMYAVVCYVCLCVFLCVFFFKQKTAYEMRISDWSSDVCSSDLLARLNSLSPSSDAHPAPLTCFSDQELDRRARTGSPARDAIGPMLAGSEDRKSVV